MAGSDGFPPQYRPPDAWAGSDSAFGSPALERHGVRKKFGIPYVEITVALIAVAFVMAMLRASPPALW